MKVIVWHVRTPGTKIDTIWWVCNIMHCARRMVPQGAVLAAAPAAPPKMSMGAVAGATFGWGGPGFVLLQLLLLAMISYMIDWVTSATGHKQFGSMAKTVSLLSGFAIVVGSIMNALSKIWEVIG